MSAFAEVIVKFLVKTFWPWFLSSAWPLIQKYIISEVTEVLRQLAETGRAAITERLAKRQSDATDRARQADAEAASAVTQEERLQHEAIARVWREVAEQFRSENEELRARIAELSAKSVSAAESQILAAKPALEELESKPSLRIGEQKSELPALTYSERRDA